MKPYFQDDHVTLYHGDCLNIMPMLPNPDKTIDMILCDLPYGTTACKWDTVIPFDPLWKEYKRLIKNNGAIVLTASQPFTSKLVMSNIEWFQYSMVWDKVNKYTDYLNAKKRPMRRHEDIIVFSSGMPIYNAQMIPVTPYKSRRSRPSRAATYGKVNGCDYGKIIFEHNPCSVIAIEGNFTTGIIHPTQKPIALFEYIIRTYTNEGDTVMDNCAGSGTTGVACMNTGRKAILIEKDAGYCDISAKRMMREISDFAPQKELFANG